jgi:cytochrome b6-f complex iron-sulfur subunit
MTQPPAPRSRRQWLLWAIRAAMGVTVAAVFYPVARYLQPRAVASSGGMEVVAPYRINDLRLFKEKGKGPPPFNFGGEPCLVILTPDNEVRAFNAVCTHLQCTVEYRPDHQDIYCPCHSGVYDLHGRNVAGPPPRPLEQYKVTLRGTAGQEEIVVSRNA